VKGQTRADESFQRTYFAFSVMAHKVLSDPTLSQKVNIQFLSLPLLQRRRLLQLYSYFLIYYHIVYVSNVPL
jgi:hypothetical protein